MCTVGTEWMSASREPGVTFTRIMPMPPASATALDLSTRAIAPRSQSTILPAVFAGSSEPGTHRRASSALAPAAATSLECTTSAGPTPVRAEDAPRTLVPSESSTVPVSSLENVSAATVVTHGEEWFTVFAVGPELPPEAETKIPASAAERKAMATGSTTEVLLPEME